VKQGRFAISVRCLPIETIAVDVVVLKREPLLLRILPMAEHSTPPPAAYSVPGWFLAVVTAPIVIGLLYFGREVLIPLAIAALLFILTAALVDRMDTAQIAGWPIPKWAARIFGVAIIFLGFTAVAVIVSNEAEDFASALPHYSERFQSLTMRLEDLLGTRIVSAIQRSMAEVDVGAWVSNLASRASGVLATFSLVMLYLAFLFAERNSFLEKLPLMASKKSDAENVRKVLYSISKSVKQYMWINTVTSAMSGAVAYLIFKIVGLDFAVALALVVFIAGFIPTIGAFIGITLPSLLALLQFDTWTPFMIVLVGYGAADQVIANVIQPMMQGKTLNLSTFMVVVSLAFWGAIWGGIGAFLAVPMMVVAMIICAEIAPLRPIAILFSGDGRLPNAERH
jgi:AI-2 transport protein TqsA